MGSVLLGGAPTPIGKPMGAYADLPATELGGYAKVNGNGGAIALILRSV